MGGSGSSSGPYRPDNVRDLKTAWEESKDANFSAQFGISINEYLRRLLAMYNDRDTELVQHRLNEALRLLGRSIEGKMQPRFGGSVAKHTFVDGISDVDVLFLMDRTELADSTPQSAVHTLFVLLSEKLGSRVSVEQGRISVKIQYKDGMELQILPALRTNSGLKVPAWASDKWSEIDPVTFTQSLTKTNTNHARLVVPTIKLAKAINATLPDSLRLSGYHLESLAIDAFRGYKGEHTLARMLVHFFTHASVAVLRPIVDRSGQSVHVDTYLGPSASQARVSASHLFKRISRRLENATANASLEQWEALFEL